MMFLICSCGLSVTEIDNTVPKTTAKFRATTTEITSQSTSENQQKVTEKTTEKQKETQKESATKKSETTTVKTETEQIKCTIEISCEKILDNKEKLKESKLDFLPENGIILNRTAVTVSEGSTAFDVIKKVCSENKCTDNCIFCSKHGIQLDYVYTPGYESYYIRGIHQIYEKDCGAQSGWMYCVNGSFLNYGCSQYKVNDGDEIKILYTCNMGEDIDAEY